MFTLRNKQYFKTLNFFLAIGGLFGVVMVFALSRSFTFEALLSGWAWGLLISFFILLGNYTILKIVNKLHFSLSVFIKGLFFTIVGITFLTIRIELFDPPEGIEINKHFAYLWVVFGTLALSFVLSIAAMIHRMLGQNVLTNIILGKYYRPREEERIFMFIDLEGSTRIAEEIGHLKFHKLLNELFYDITFAILDSGGEIYKYVGDEIIVTWNTKIGVKHSRCIKLYFDVVDKLNRKREKYKNTYGLMPHFRAGLHYGKVVVGELGSYKREIAYLGDTVNTTARIQEECKILGIDLLISSSLLDILPDDMPYNWENLGTIRLKGKKKMLELVKVSR